MKIFFREGAEAYRDGISIDDCPYAESWARAEKEWERGWWTQAEFDSMSKVDERETIQVEDG